MCDPELGALEDIRGDISVPLTRMLGHWWAISGPEMLLARGLVPTCIYVGRVLYVPEAHLSLGLVYPIAVVFVVEVIAVLA